MAQQFQAGCIPAVTIVGCSDMELSDAQKREFNSHVLMAKDLFSKQEYHKALKHYQQANQLCRSDRLEAKISKLMVCLYYYVLI